MQQLALEDQGLSPHQSNTQEVGKIFIQARQERGLSLSEIAQVLHIRQVYLEAIEQGNLDVLPGRVYTIGFMKKYAEFLNLDYSELQRRLDLRNDDYTTVVVGDIVQPYAMANYRNPVWLSLILVVLGGGGYSYFHLRHAIKPNVDLVQAPPAIIEPATTDRLFTTQQESQQITQEAIAEPTITDLLPKPK